MSAYDQTKGELCDKCGWAMKFPGEPCRCELERENAALRELAARMATEMREVDHEFASLRDYDAARKEAQP